MIRPVALLFCCAPLLAQAPGTIQTIAGTGPASFSSDGGQARSAALNVPVDVSADRNGNLFIADQFNHRIRRIAPDGVITTVAGNGAAGFSGDGGQAREARLNTPTGVFADASGNLFIADVANQRIRRVDSSGVITTVAGNGVRGSSGDGGPATSASLNNTVRVAVDPSGNLLLADQSNHRVRRVTPAGVISTFAGTGAMSFSGDGGPATSAAFNNPTALAIDAAGQVYICDQLNHRIRRVDTGGTVTTVAGNGAPGFSGDGPALTTQLNFPGGIALDAAGNIYFNDDVNYRLRRLTNGTITTIGGNGTQGFSGDGGLATAASLNGNFGVTLDLQGNIFFADSTNNRIREVFAEAGAPPTITSAGFTNGASFASGGTPGAIATLFGTRLTRNLSGIVQNTGVPLPASLAGVSVTVAGLAAPVFNVVNLNGQEQISFQIPVEASIGTVPVTLSNGAATTKIDVALTQAQPGIFPVNVTQAAALHANFTLISAASPAAPGETIILFCTGLGAVNPPVATGTAASAAPPSLTVLPYTATVASLDAPVGFSGLAPGFVALGQVNLTVPTGAPSGLQDLQISSGAFRSNVLKLQIR